MEKDIIALAEFIGFRKEERKEDVGAFMPDWRTITVWTDGKSEYPTLDSFLFFSDWNWLMRVRARFEDTNLVYTDDVMDMFDSLGKTYASNDVRGAYDVCVQLLEALGAQQ